MKYGQWISVTEKLPEDGQECIIFDKTYGVLCGIFIKTLEIWETKENRYWYDIEKNVTHWMPVHEPPSDKMEVVGRSIQMNYEEIINALQTLKDMCIKNDCCVNCPCGNDAGKCLIFEQKPSGWVILYPKIIKCLE